MRDDGGKDGMPVKTGADLFKHELKDLYDAEFRQAQALTEMAEKVPDGKLAEALREHREETQGHIKRLESVFEAVGETPQKEACAGVIGLVKEYKDFTGENPAGKVLNVFTAEAALKAEHYEIVSYSGLIKLAGQLGQTEVIDLLQQNLEEELATAQNLEIMSEQLGEELALQG
ncbi:MAG: ferritin-like domain-containing protein [Actinomycetota bacterium]